jgi:hypothetical protein
MNRTARATAGDRVAVGIRVKTGRAIAVALAGRADAPRFCARTELLLHDPDDADSYQPWHAALDQPPALARAIVARLTEVVYAAAERALDGLWRELAATASTPRGAGLVVASRTDPATVRSAHLHAHAAEGRLFFDAVRTALEQRRLAPLVLVEKTAAAEAAKIAGVPAKELAAAAASLRAAAGAPWRTDERSAALAALAALAMP